MRNDGIGGTPRLARYTSIGTPPHSEPTPNRPPRSPAAQRALTRALDALNVHLPSRLGECRRCDVAAPCKPFLRALVIVQRWDPSKARRVRAVLHLSGLWSPGQQQPREDGTGA